MKKLMLGLMIAFAATAEAYIDGIDYEFNYGAGTATIKGCDRGNPPTKVDVAEVESDWGKKYTVTSVGKNAFRGCSSLTSVSLPNATTIGESAFDSCGSLEKVSLPNATTIENDAFFQCPKLEKIIVNAPMAMALKNNKSFYGIQNGCKILPEYCVVVPHPVEHTTAKVYTDGAEVTSNPIVVLSNATVEVVFTVVEEGYCFEDHSTVQTNTVTATDDPTTVVGPEVVKIPSLLEEETQQAGWKTETTLTVSTALKSGDTTLDKAAYENACLYYGIEAKAEPTAEDFRVVSKDAQVVQEDEIAVKKESIAAPSAGTVTVEDNKVQLGVTVLKTSDLTAEKKEWNPVKLTKADIDVDADGNIIVNVPVDSSSGFMVIQTKDAAK